MRTSSRLIALAVVFLASLQIIGCGGAGSPANNSNNTGSTSTASSPVSITTTSLPGATVGTSYSQTLASKGGTAPLTWSISAGALPAGLSITPSTGAITGTPTGPASSTAVSFTAKVTDSSSPATSSTAQLGILVSTSGPLTLTPGSETLASGTVGTTYSQTFLASGGTPPYTFVVAGSNPLPLGLTATPSGGTFIISGIPSAACSGCAFSIAVTDSAGTPAVVTDNLTVTINPIALSCGSGSESLLNGQYAMLLEGFDNGAGAGESAAQPAEWSGVLFLDGAGNIGSTSTLFYNTNATVATGPQQYQNVVGSYQVGSDHRGCMAIVTPAGIQHYYFSLASISGNVASSGHIESFDSAGPFTSGVLLKQDPSAFANIAGTYAFAVSSPQNSVGGNGAKLGMAGVLTLVGNGGITAGTVDVNVAGVLNGSNNTSWSSATPLTIDTGGTVSINTFNGSGAILFPVHINGAPFNIQFSAIVVSTSQILLMAGSTETDTEGLFGAGEALLQTSTTFSNASLNGTSVLGVSGIQSGRSLGMIGTIASASDGSYVLSAWQNSGGALSAQSLSLAAGSITVNSNGRVVLPGSGTPVLWLVGLDEGFYLGSDGTVQTGFFQQQTSTSTTLSGVSYTIGTVDPQTPGADLQTGIENFGSTTVTETTDDNIAGALTPNNSPSVLSYSVNGATGPSGCTIGASTNGCQVLVYVISPTQAIQMNLLTSAGAAETTPIVEPATQ